MKQLANNFLLKNHSEPLLRRESYHDKTKKFLNQMGMRTIFSFDNEWHAHDEEALFSLRNDDEGIADFRTNFPEFSNHFIRRQTCVSKGKVVVTSEKYDHQGKVDNSYILVRRSIMGQVMDIMEVQCDGVSRFFSLINLITRSAARPDATAENMDGTPRSRTLGKYQFIAEETDEFSWAEVESGDLVQKLFHGYTTFLFNKVEKTCLYVAVHVNCFY